MANKIERFGMFFVDSESYIVLCKIKSEDRAYTGDIIEYFWEFYRNENMLGDTYIAVRNLREYEYVFDQKNMQNAKNKNELIEGIIRFAEEEGANLKKEDIEDFVEF